MQYTQFKMEIFSRNIEIEYFLFTNNQIYDTIYSDSSICYNSVFLTNTPDTTRYAQANIYEYDAYLHDLSKDKKRQGYLFDCN